MSISLNTRCAPVAEQLGHDALHAFQRVRDGARLLEDFLLHVVAVGAQLGRAAVRLHGAAPARVTGLWALSTIQYLPSCTSTTSPSSR